MSVSIYVFMSVCLYLLNLTVVVAPLSLALLGDTRQVGLH